MFLGLYSTISEGTSLTTLRRQLISGSKATSYSGKDGFVFLTV